METKSHSDLEQSKKLTEILDKDTADGFYCNGIYWTLQVDPFSKANAAMKKLYPNADDYIPAWSLAALLSVLSFPALRYDIEDGEGGWIVSCEKNGKKHLSYYRDNPVDTCYEMIVKLHEQKLI